MLQLMRTPVVSIFVCLVISPSSLRACTFAIESSERSITVAASSLAIEPRMSIVSGAADITSAAIPSGKPAGDVITDAAPRKGYYVTYIAMGFALITSILAILRALRKWSLAEALTEDTGNGVFKASISRLIALLGFVVIICIYLGTGCSVIYRILGGGSIGDLGGLGTFLVGAAALFTPYLANQIKGAVIGVANGPTGSSQATAPVITAFSPKGVQSGTPQVINITGSNLTQIQSAICTDQDGSEVPITSSSVNVQNAGAVQITVTMLAVRPAGSTYQSVLTLVTDTNQRIHAGTFTVS
jgi:hypothetical protein